MPLVVHAAYRNTIEADTPLFYWPMDETAGATSLTAAVGGTAINLTGATTGQSGNIDGTSVSFDGINDFGATATSIDLTAYSKIVVESLFYFNPYTNSDKIAWELSTGNSGFTFVSDAINQANKSNVLLFGNVGYNFAYFTRPSTSNWHHIVAVYDKSATTNETSLYIDGELQTAVLRPATSNNTNNFGNFVFNIMRRASGTLFSGGKMQHMAIYSNLNDSQILAHAQAGGFINTLSSGVVTESTATLSWTNISGGVAPVISQLQRSPTGAGTWSDVSGATTSPVTDTGLSIATTYDYRVAYTDATPTTVYSNTVTITTSGNTTTYTVQQADLWDNGYDNVAVPRQSSFSRFVFTTDASSVTIGGTTSLYNNYPQYSHLGVRINGVEQSPLAFTANGSQSFTVALGTAGTTRTVEITSGLLTKPSIVMGSFIDSVTYSSISSFSVTTPTLQTNRILVYGDSISVGANATNPESQGYVPLLRNTYNYSVMIEGWGYSSLYQDTNTSELRNAFVSRIAGYTPSII